MSVTAKIRVYATNYNPIFLRKMARRSGFLIFLTKSATSKDFLDKLSMLCHYEKSRLSNQLQPKNFLKNG